MKIYLLVVLVILGINAKAQIMLEHTYDTASCYAGNINQLMIVKFEISGERYVKINRMAHNISIYDLNHSLIKVIDCSSYPLPTNQIFGDVLYLSEQLFDTDPAIELMYVTGVPNPPGYDKAITKIYKENGVLIFSDTASPSVHPNIALQQYPIYNTPQGTKMILSYPNGQAKVYSLPGTLTTAIHEANNLLMAQNSVSNAYPNPTNSSTRIDYTFPNGVDHGEIVFYDLQGKEIRRYKVDRTFDHLLISTADIPAGTYFYQLQTSSQVSAGKKMVVIK